MAATDILIAGATVLYAAPATALPNINTVAFNSYANWTGWTSLGVTASPVRVRFDKEYYSFDAQQYAQPYLIRLVGKRVTARFEIAEMTGTALGLLLDGIVSTQSPGAGTKGVSTIDYGSDFVTTEKRWGVEGFRLDANGTLQPVRWFLYKAVLSIEGELNFNKREHTRAACTLTCMADTAVSTQSLDTGKLQIVTAPATS